MKQFDKVGIIKQAWEILKKHANVFILVMGVYVIYYIAQFVTSGYTRFSPVSSLVSLFFTAISIILEMGTINLTLKILDGKTPQIADLYNYPDLPIKALKTFAASILYGLMVVVGLILLVVPGIYLAIRGQFYVYYIVEKNAGVLDSLKMSWNLTKNNVINIFLFELLILGINIIGVLLLGVGLLVTIPLSFVAITILFRKLQ